MPTRCERNRNSIEVRRLEHDLVGVRVNLCVGATHDAGDGYRAAVIRNDEVGGIKRADDVVQCPDRFTAYCTPYDDVAGEPRAVKCVQRLTQVEHHVVRDVDRE